jgi:non-ribosomal peptide synthetase component F
VQVIAVLAVTSLGATYLPINPSDPDERIAAILGLAECTVVLTQLRASAGRFWMSDAMSLVLVSAETLDPTAIPHFPVELAVDPDSVAYIIFTSGTEGAPKGVEITHRGAVNTCLDINARFGITEADTVFALSSLSFDLSVWDIFGVLGAGGTVVICKPGGTRDPDYWWSQVRAISILQRSVS